MPNTPRTTAALVEQVLLTDYDRASQFPLDRFVKAASLVVDRVRACAAAKGLDLSAEELTEVETWVAAHMYVMSDQNLTAASPPRGGQTGPRPGQYGLRMEASKYGQHALLIDYSGCLHAIDKRQFAFGYWIGKPPSESIPYEDRR